jgi:hypothetical protein
MNTALEYSTVQEWSRRGAVACRSMKMKVHQTLVWLNLLSFGTKDLAEPTIGIRSAVVDEARAKSGLSAENSYAANHLTKTFTNNTAPPLCLYHTSVPSVQLYTELSAVLYVQPPPLSPIPTLP